MTSSQPDPVTLDPGDPVEAAMIRMVETNRKKRNDYTIDPQAGPFWNFERVAEQVGTTRRMVVEMFIATKQARLQALLTSGREPQNEAVEDTVLDRAVYAVIALAMLQEESASRTRPDEPGVSGGTLPVAVPPRTGLSRTAPVPADETLNHRRA